MAKRSSTSTRQSLFDAGTRVCVLHGSEPMVKRLHLDTLREAMNAAHGEADLIRFDGQSVSLADVFDELRSFSLMQQHKLVVVDDAEAFVTAYRAAIERYTANPVDHATLVFICRRWNRGNLDKLIAKVGVIIKCDVLTSVQAKPWLTKRAQGEHNRTLTPQAAGALVDRLGCDLMRLDSELAKLALIVESGEPITPGHVDQVVGRSSDEQAWVIQEAILTVLASSSGRSESGWSDSRGGSGGAVSGGAIEKVHELVDQAGQAGILVSYFVADLIRKLYLGFMMKRQGHGDQQIAGRFKLWGPRRAIFFAAIQRLDEGVLKRMFDQVVRYDLRSKSGQGDSVRNLECFCASLADRP